MSFDPADWKRRLLALWHEAEDGITPKDSGGASWYAHWAGATKDLLMGMGLRWDDAANEYTFDRVDDPPCADCGRPHSEHRPLWVDIHPDALNCPVDPEPSAVYRSKP